MFYVYGPVLAVSVKVLQQKESSFNLSLVKSKYIKYFLTLIVVQEPPPACTDSSDDQMSDSTESSILLEPGSPSPPPVSKYDTPPTTLHPLIPITIKMETQDNDDIKGDIMALYDTVTL